MKQGAEDFPLMVVMSFIYVCNAKCPNCPYNNSSIRGTYGDALYISDELFKKVADECGQYGAYIRISGGGEPMLHPHALDLLAYAKNVGAKIGLITNGSRMSQKSAEKLLKKNVDVIEFSVDAADEETYNKVRPGLNWLKLNKNVERLVSLRNALNSTTKIIVSAINQEGVDVEQVKQYWSSKVDNVQIRKYLTWGYNEDKSADTTPYLPPEQMIPCPWLFERLNIDSRGDITICGEDIAFAYKFANVKERSIKEIWNGVEFKEWREKHLNKQGHTIEICSKCPDWKYRSWQHNYWKLIKNAEK